MSRFQIDIKPFGKRAILIEWPNKIEDEILDDIIQFSELILTRDNNELINHTKGYNSLLLQYNSNIDFKHKKELLLDLYKSSYKTQQKPPKCWHIPVCYDEEFGLDLPLFENQGLDQADVIALHTQSRFRIYMIGFLPGFLYLGGLPKALHMNRKDTPRLNIPKGSVAIGGEQTGIYPMSSPGGWQIIGRTPLTLFDLNKNEPTPIKHGDFVQFYSIDMKTYQNLSSHES